MILSQFVWTQRGLRRWMESVQAQLRAGMGWKLAELRFHSGVLGLRILCVAVLEK